MLYCYETEHNYLGTNSNLWKQCRTTRNSTRITYEEQDGNEIQKVIKTLSSVLFQEDIDKLFFFEKTIWSKPAMTTLTKASNK